MDAVFRMIHGTIIEKCLVAPQLFKAANIMKDANEPGQINVLFSMERLWAIRSESAATRREWAYLRFTPAQCRKIHPHRI